MCSHFLVIIWVFSTNRKNERFRGASACDQRWFDRSFFGDIEEFQKERYDNNSFDVKGVCKRLRSEVEGHFESEGDAGRSYKEIYHVCILQKELLENAWKKPLYYLSRAYM